LLTIVTQRNGDDVEERVIEDPVLRQRYSFRTTVGEDGGEVLHVDIRVDPGGGVTPHIHPQIEERFEVLEGRPSLLAGRTWQTVGPGETVVVAPGVRHSYRNTGDEVAHMVCHVRPPSTLQPFLEDAAALSRAGKITRQGLPKGLDALLQAAVMVEAYRDMVTLLFPPLPPPAVQRVVMPPLARLGRRRGYRAGRLAEGRTSSAA
jgi:quercetin dioxygenase-like cupin family protein